VVGAIYSGIASIMLAMSIIRKVYNLENYLKPVHYDNLGKLLFAMTCIWFYFTFAEYLTAFYGREPHEMDVFWTKFHGVYMLPFWTMFVTCFIIPFAILVRKKTRTITGINIASIAILIGMWLERYIIIVPTLANPRLPLPRGSYFPTWIEWSIFLGVLSGFLLVYVLFTKLFPIISIWEIKEGKELSLKEVTERVHTYLPDEVKT
jgi:molybdopterin-containing oxidoreductase family membrane subunit